MPDTVGLNGFKARVTCLTHPGVVSSKISSFDGKVRWVGVTCDTTYEISGAGPFVHRRVLFKSTVPWPAGALSPASPNPSGGVGSGEYIRAVSDTLGNAKLTGCLRRLFAQDTVRGVVQGPTSSLGITVLKNETKNMRGSEDGVRIPQRYWNTLEGEPTMQYNILPTGQFDLSLANAPSSQHVYLVDVFSYGLEGLDSPLPDPKTQLQGVPSGLNGGASLPARGGKRAKLEPSEVEMGGVSDDSSTGSTSSEAARPLRDPMSAFESEDNGWVNITTVMKLYFRQA